MTDGSIQVFMLQIYQMIGFSGYQWALGSAAVAAPCDLHFPNPKAKSEREEVNNHDKHPLWLGAL